MNAPGTNPNWQKLVGYEFSGKMSFPTQFDSVRMFHILAGLPVSDFTTDTNTPEERNTRILRRITLIQEEVNSELIPNLDELRFNWTTANLAKVLHELVDVSFVILGTAVELGLPYDSAFAVVNEANLRKVKDEVVRRDDGKILKPEGWEPANLVAFLEFVLAQRVVPAPAASDSGNQEG